MAKNEIFFHNLTQKKLSCGKSLIELTMYNNIPLWLFTTQNFHQYVDNLDSSINPGKKNRLNLRLIFFYKKIEVILDIVMMIILKIFSNIFKENSKVRTKKRKARIIFTALNTNWREVIDYKTRTRRKSYVLFDSFIKEVDGQYEVIGTSPLDFFPFKMMKTFFEKSSCQYILYKPLNLYWSIKVWKKQRDVFKHFKRIWKILEHDKVFRNICIYQGKDYNHSIKSKLNIFFYYWFPLFIKYIELANGMISQEKPNLVLIENEISGFGRALVVSGKIKHIPTIAIQHGEFTPTDYGYILPDQLKNVAILPDKTCVYGHYYSNLLVKSSIYESEEIIVTGSPRSDILFNLSKIYSKKRFLKKNNINPNHTIILWTTQCHGMSDEENVQNLETVFETIEKFDNITLIIKQHPGEGKKYTKMFQKYLKQYKIDFLLAPSKSDTYEQLNTCDILITKHSTTAMEAIAIKKDVIIINLSGKPDVVDYVDKGVALGVYQKKELKKTIEKLLDGYDKFSKFREKYIREFLYKIDGNATKRIVDAGLKMMKDFLS